MKYESFRSNSIIFTSIILSVLFTLAGECAAQHSAGSCTGHHQYEAAISCEGTSTSSEVEGGMVFKSDDQGNAKGEGKMEERSNGQARAMKMPPQSGKASSSRDSDGTATTKFSGGKLGNSVDGQLSFNQSDTKCSFSLVADGWLIYDASIQSVGGTIVVIEEYDAICCVAKVEGEVEGMTSAMTSDRCDAVICVTHIPADDF